MGSPTFLIVITSVEERASVTAMNLEEVLNMVGGNGETSYAANSRHQRNVLAKAKFIVQETVANLYCTLLPEIFVMADLGCSSGPNTLKVISDTIETIGDTCHRLGRWPAEVQFFLNDLPGNDFNTIFRALPSFKKKVEEEREGRETVPFYVVGVPGSFYGKLFPHKSIHLIHSSYSLHWLSQGILREEDVHTFNLPFYAPSLEELMNVVQYEGSFELKRRHIFETNWDGNDDCMDDFIVSSSKSGENVAKSLRAVLESLLAQHFGEAVLDELFAHYTSYIAAQLLKEKMKYVNFVLCLEKKA